MNALTDKLAELKMGLRRNDPAFCGDAPAWLIETVLPNLKNVMAQAPNVEDEEAKRFALGAIRYVADQATVDVDALLERLNDLLVTTS